MQNKEVVEQLKLTLDYCMRADPDAYNEIEALKHAITCVELMPKFVEMLKITVCEGSCCDCDNCDVGELLKKAKEMIE